MVWNLPPVLPDSCKLGLDKQGEVRVLNPESCPDKQLVQYLNCNGLQIKNLQKKECQ
jgi:hypothetical protein